MSALITSSTHMLARELLARDESPLRMRTVGRYAIIWDGKDGDYIEKVSTEEIFGHREPHGPGAPDA